MLTEAATASDVPQNKHRARPARPPWLWAFFFVLLAAALVGAYVLICESPDLADIRYLAQYPHEVSLSGSAVGYYRWRYDSIVAHAPLNCPLAVVIDGRRLNPADLTPRTLTALGASASRETRSTLWRLVRGRDSLWCDFRDDTLVQLWVSHDSAAPEWTGQGQALALIWNDGPPAHLPLDGENLPTHFGAPQELTKASKLRFLAGL